MDRSYSDEYLAGFFDGEGSVGIYVQGGRYTIKAAVTNTYFPILEYLHKRFGGHLYAQPTLPLRKPVWKWSIGSASAVKFLEVLRPHLMEKEPQVWLALEFWANRESHCGKTVTEEQKALRLGYSLALKNAKHLRLGAW